MDTRPGAEIEQGAAVRGAEEGEEPFAFGCLPGFDARGIPLGGRSVVGATEVVEERVAGH